MSNYNPVYNPIWSSNKFNKLDVNGKLIFLYLLTNSKATQTGIYSIMLRQIACDTGLSAEIVKLNIAKMQSIGMIKFWEEDNLIFIYKNFLFSKGTIKNPKKLQAIIKRQKELILNQEVWELFDNSYKTELDDLNNKVLINNQTNNDIYNTHNKNSFENGDRDVSSDTNDTYRKEYSI